nr:MAG TPA: hypothetical protein [Caudoviricetes sp.]
MFYICFIVKPFIGIISEVLILTFGFPIWAF